MARCILYTINLDINTWVGGRCPMVLAEFVASAPLMLLLKPDDGIQLIGVGLFGSGWYLRFL